LKSEIKHAILLILLSTFFIGGFKILYQEEKKFYPAGGAPVVLLDKLVDALQAYRK